MHGSKYHSKHSKKQRNLKVDNRSKQSYHNSKKSSKHRGYGYYGGYQYKQGGGSQYHGGGYNAGNSQYGNPSHSKYTSRKGGGSYRHHGSEYNHHGSGYNKYGGQNFTLPGQNRSSKFVLNQPLAKMKSKSNNSNYKKYGHNYKLGQRRHGAADPIAHIVQEDRSSNKYLSPYSQRALKAGHRR